MVQVAANSLIFLGMKKRSNSDDKMTIMDAVENLSRIAEVDKEPNTEAVERGIKANLQKFKKLQEGEKKKTLKTIKGTFKTVHKYLEHLYKKESENFQDVEIQREVKAIMGLAGEAADKLKGCTSFFQHTQKRSEGGAQGLKEYENLKEFYLNKIVKRFQRSLKTEEDWEKKWAEIGDETIDVEKLGLKDLETVKRDKNYELFYIRKKDGKLFFNQNLLRHIRLVNDFDQALDFEGVEDPLIHVHLLRDSEVQYTANKMREQVRDEGADFYVDALSHQDLSIIQRMNKVTMSLLLASNPKHLRQNTSEKTCFSYFHDFQVFLREVLTSSDYHRLVSTSLRDVDRLSQNFISLSHAYCFALFVHEEKQRDCIDYIRDLVDRGKADQKIARPEMQDALTFWNDLLDIHDVLSSILKMYPSGPFFKTLDAFLEREKEVGFDPIYQGNLPAYQFTFSSQSFETHCLRLPCPTLHRYIEKAEVIEEFKGYLRYLDQKKSNVKHLLFNLQERNSWEEQARCSALEELTKQGEYAESFVLVTLPKKTDFYFQSVEHKEMSLSVNFLKSIGDQLSHAKVSGFFFSECLPRKEVDPFVKKITDLIYRRVFKSKKGLSRRERLDFIEIFYQLLMLKVLDLVRPEFFSFTCKDGVDIGSTTGACFYSILKMISKDDAYDKQEQDQLLWMLYVPSIMTRERLVDDQRLSRMMSALIAFHEGLAQNRKDFLEELKGLYDGSFLKKVQLRWGNMRDVAE